MNIEKLKDAIKTVQEAEKETNIKIINPDPEILEHLETLLENQNKESEKITWKISKKSNDLTLLECSNKHKLTIFKTDDGQIIVSIDGGPNRVIKGQDDLQKIKIEVEKMQ